MNQFIINRWLSRMMENLRIGKKIVTKNYLTVDLGDNLVY